MSPADMYDEDDLVDHYDEYEKEDELSPEDRAAMSKGTADVKTALGSDASKVSTKQIEEALWHYYYDVDKSVAYLKKSFAPPIAKPTVKKTPDGQEFLAKSILQSREQRYSLGLDRDVHCSIPKHSFLDMPWMNVPQERLADLLPPPWPRGGLLGGGEGPGKISKLQALAAARKKKTDEKREQDRASQAESSLKRLSLLEPSNNADTCASPSPAKRPKNLETPVVGLKQKMPTSDTVPPQQDQPAMSSLTADAGVGARMDHDPTTSQAPGSTSIDNVTISVSNAAPSAFAKTLFGSAPDWRQANRPNVYALPYASSPAFLATAFSEPSPDDIVFAAQAKAGKKTAATPKATKKPSEDAKKQSELSNHVSNLKINEAPPPKSKGLDVIKEFENSQVKRSTSFVVVGHVDAGKSTLMGRLLLELKFVEQRTVDKYRRQAEKAGKQSFALAWVMDQGSEERDRGVTIDIATNHFETPTTKFTILDAPGHRDFVPNMIAGASQADFAILVIDANTGAFEKGLKGQTREHVLLLRSLGVQRIIVAVNKLDMVDWSKERFDEISGQVDGFLTGLGFQSKHISFVPISGLDGDNIASRIENAAASWYTGPTLMEALESSGPSAARALTKPFRMPISEVFRSQQGTTTLAGRIDCGTIQVGDGVLLQPSGESAYIKSIVVDTDNQDWAVAGQSVSIALTNIDPIHIRVGDIVCDATNPINCGDTFVMKAMAFEHVMPMPVDLHRGRLHAPGQIQSITATLNKATGEVMRKKPKIVQPGGVARMQIKLNSRVPLEAGQRVVIRSQGETIAAGLLE
ncbi:hypothetical protein HIM_11262 [Hirsutella minnesotensis 3608]|uniref:Elongation factor 1 alpha-like protein n=1 Tax=Hirsutella minnesotensis 3608 TaxID=1043627 RepID=A0A0F7ZJ64_9HYPO|nr:hypothetical protein HIM_11262 [Hirsutella minnesotensis 3608]